jgi:hypothetical protein
MNAAKNCTARFLQRYALVVDVTGAGAGSISSSPGGIDCGQDCQNTYIDGTRVTLTATPANSSVFVGWQGDCAADGEAAAVTVNSAKSCTAEFALKQLALNVTMDGDGSGRVTSDPAGISCQSDCNQNYTYGTRVTLSAVADRGVVFTGWSGGCQGGDAVTQVTMDRARTCTATFMQNFNITVSVIGSGTASLDGQQCASNGSGVIIQCIETRVSGTAVTLIAQTEFTNYVFDRWSGDCSGTSPQITVTMDSDKLCIANFRELFGLFVDKAGSGTGTVTSSPAGIDCGVDCDQQYLDGTRVTLTARPDTGSFFVAWRGDCAIAETSATAQLTMNSDKKCSAEFTTLILIDGPPVRAP